MALVLSVISFIVGVIITYLCLNFVQINWGQKPEEAISNYTDFISIMLTFITIVLGSVAIGIGVVGYYTLRNLQKEVLKNAQKTINELMESHKKEINIFIQAELNKGIYSGSNISVNKELTRGFDQTDGEER